MTQSTRDSRLASSRRGIAPIVSTLLMVVVVVTASSIAVLWSGGALQQLSDFFGNQSSRVQEAIAIEEVYTFRNSSTVFTVRPYVRDIGPVAVYLSAAFISWSPSVIKQTSITPNKVLGSGQLTSITFTLSKPPPAATTITVKVVTSRGTSDTLQVFVP